MHIFSILSNFFCYCTIDSASQVSILECSPIFFEWNNLVHSVSEICKLFFESRLIDDRAKHFFEVHSMKKKTKNLTI
nr:MAG TPA: hypothetical protein [Caudoviricetes sp.]